jgi:hypothetical protein
MPTNPNRAFSAPFGLRATLICLLLATIGGFYGHAVAKSIQRENAQPTDTSRDFNVIKGLLRLLLEYPLFVPSVIAIYAGAGLAIGVVPIAVYSFVRKARNSNARIRGKLDE